MPTTDEQIKEIKSRNDEAAKKMYESTSLASGATTLYDNVMKAVRDDRAKRGISSLAQDVGTTTGQLVSDPSGIKARRSLKPISSLSLVQPMLTST